MEQGAVHDGCITCPWHGSVFRVDNGALMQGPSTVDLPSYECRVTGTGRGRGARADTQTGAPTARRNSSSVWLRTSTRVSAAGSRSSRARMWAPTTAWYATASVSGSACGNTPRSWPITQQRHERGALLGEPGVLSNRSGTGVSPAAKGGHAACVPQAGAAAARPDRARSSAIILSAIVNSGYSKPVVISASTVAPALSPGRPSGCPEPVRTAVSHNRRETHHVCRESRR